MFEYIWVGSRVVDVGICSQEENKYNTEGQYLRPAGAFGFSGVGVNDDAAVAGHTNKADCFLGRVGAQTQNDFLYYGVTWFAPVQLINHLL